MKHLNLFFYPLLLIAGLLASISVSFASDEFVIGILDDCQATQQRHVLEQIKKETFSLTKGEFRVRFSSDHHRISNCSEKGLTSDLNRMMSNPDIDMILALGPLGSHLLGRMERFPKPVISGMIINSQLQGIPFHKGKSMKHNFTYVLLSPDLKANVDQLREVVDFKKAALLYDRSIDKSLKSERTTLENITKDIQADIVLMPVGNRADPVISQMDPSIDAVIITDLVQLDKEELTRLISYFNQNKIASFSLHDRSLIEKGLLAGFDRSAVTQKFSRRIALMIQRVLLDENPKDFKVGFTSQESLVLNMQTARQLDISPGFAVLAKAELINYNSAIRQASPAAVQKKTDAVVQKPKPAAKTPVKDIVLSDLATGSSGGLIEAQLGIDGSGESLNLLGAVNRALSNNLILKAKEKETRAGEMDVKKVLSRFYPQLNAGLNGTMIDDDHTSALMGISERSWEITAGVSQLLYSDQVMTNLTTRKHQQQVRQLSENQEELDIILETCIAYLTALKAIANARIQLDNLKLIRNNLKLANNRYKAGYSSPSDVFRLESESANAYASLLDSLSRLGKARLHLNQVLNLELEADTVVEDIHLDGSTFFITDPKIRSELKIDNPKSFKKVRDFIVKKGLVASPELKAINEQILVQEALYASAKKSYWSPNVFVNGKIGNTFSRSGEGSDFNAASLPGNLGDLVNEPEDTAWALSLNIDLPFYEGGAKSASKIKALETRNQLTFYKYHVKNQISENIRSALMDLSASYPSIELSSMSARAAKRNLDLVQDAYSKGAISIIHFLDAQNASLVANTLAENAIYDFFIDLVISERASGKYSFFMDENEKQQWYQEFSK